MKEKNNQGKPRYVEGGNRRSLVAVQVKPIYTKRGIGSQATSDHIFTKQPQFDNLGQFRLPLLPIESGCDLVCKENLRMSSSIGIRASTADKEG